VNLGPCHPRMPRLASDLAKRLVALDALLTLFTEQGLDRRAAVAREERTTRHRARRVVG